MDRVTTNFFFQMMRHQEIMIEPVYFDTCLCFYFDKNLKRLKIFKIVANIAVVAIG